MSLSSPARGMTVRRVALHAPLIGRSRPKLEDFPLTDCRDATKGWFQESRSWSGGSKRAGVDPGSKIRLEPIREPGSAPAKPLGSRGSLRGPRVAAGLVVERPRAPNDQSFARQPDRRRFETSERPATFETSSETRVGP